MAKQTETVQSDIGELVRKAENDYVSGVSNTSKYVTFSQYENIEKIDAYLNSKHTTGEFDSLDREKPFFNIVTAAVNIWYRATDIDRKNIKIKATRQDHKVMAYVASLHLQQWMRKSNFGAFLNDWGRSLARYGSTPLKFVKKNGELLSSVIPWNRLISDTVDFENNPKIEILWLTPAQLKQNKSYDQEIVEQLLDTLETRETTGKQTKDNKSEYIKLYEIHGNLPLSYLTGKDKDADTYAQQMQVITFVAKKEKGKFDDFVLFKGKEAQDPFILTHLIREDGRAQSIGAVEYLFEAQWMANHSQKLIKDQLDLASRTIHQTADGTFVGQNILTGLEVGDILVHAPNSPITRLDNRADIVSLQNYGQQWQVLGKELTSTSGVIGGEKQPSDVAWRTIEAQRQESHSLFEQMIENKGLDIELMMRRFIIPYLEKQMDTKEELAATLDSQGIQEFDSMYVPNEAIRRDNEQIKNSILSGEVAQNADLPTLELGIKKQLSMQGNQRFVTPDDLGSKTWKEALKDFEWECEVDVTGEARDKEAVMTTLTTVLQTLATNPGVLQDPNMKLLFNKILETTDAISPLELANTPPAPLQPAVAGSSGGQQQNQAPNGNNPQPVPA